MALNTEYDIVKAFEAIEDELMASMIRNMKDHKLEEIDENKQWSMWQAEQLKSLEKYRRSNQKKFGSEFDKINRKIEALIRTAKDEGEMDQEIEILKAIKKGFKAKKVSPGVAVEFFKINDRKLDALIDSVNNDMKKAETAILRMANDQYRKIIYNAQVYANTGAGTYEKAVDMATKDFIAAGLNCVEYANGARHSLKDYADMAIRTASKRAYLQGEGTKRQEWGISTVIVNKRGNPCPKCLPFCGKVLIDDVWSGGSKKDGNYPFMSYAIQCGLYHPRCRDVHTTYFPGISTADDTWTDEELEAIGIKSKQENERQYAKRQKEKFDRMSRFSLDEENRKRYTEKSKEWKEVVENVDLLKISGDAPNEAKDVFEREYSMIPIKHQKLIEDEIQKIIVDLDGNSRYDKTNRIMYLDKNLETGEVLHEMAHVLEKKLGLYQNEKFIEVLKSGLEEFSWEMLSYVPDEYGRPVCFLHCPKFVSEYQGRMYEEVGFWNDSDEFNVYSLAEYFAEGYREYLLCPDNLMQHDIKLYDFIEDLLK
ncbi:MAG: phage minor capsid protein [Agathobacter sp.]